MSDVQISAYISEETKAMLETYVNSQGLKKGFFIEEALRFHLQAMAELPEDLVINPDIRLTTKSFKELSKAVENDSEPTQALKGLWRG